MEMGWQYFLRAGLGLLVVAAALAGLVWLLKKLNQCGFRQCGSVEILNTSYLAHKEKIMCIQVEGVKLLLGVTPHQINTLHVFDKDDSDVIG